MNNEPQVSVCMATYNGERYVFRQIQSILKQLSNNDELVISDDGSSDRTLQIINSFNDDRIRIYKNNLNKGPIGNFENALKNTTGEIIFLADQDDEWFDNKVERHLSLHYEADLVISNAIVVNDVQEVIFPSFFSARGSTPGFFNNLKKNSYIGCCMSFNSRIKELSTPFPAGIHMHDWWIGLVAELSGKTYFCDEILLRYLRHGSNASATLEKKLPFLSQLHNRVTLLLNLSALFFKKNLRK